MLVDAQLDAMQCEVLQIGFDPMDVPRSEFVTGGRAWQMCRSGQADPGRFGIAHIRGLGFVRGNLVHDLATLNKLEMLPWDCWGVILRAELDDAGDLRALDEIAALSAGDVPDFDEVRRRYRADARLRLDGSFLSYVNGEMLPVESAVPNSWAARSICLRTLSTSSCIIRIAK